MASARLVVVSAVIACYIAGATLSLFGPAWGRFLGVAAFLATLALMTDLIHQSRRGALEALLATTPVIARFRPLIWGLMILCVAIYAAAWVTEALAAQGAGSAHGTFAVFEDRAEYLLNRGGVFTAVSQTRYRVVGTCFVVAWHSFGLLFALLALHVILYGRWPPGFPQGSGSS
jgi:hypothetical protein